MFSAGTLPALRNTSGMANRPRIILVLPDATECATVAEWLVTDGFEPVRRPSPRTAVEEMRARPFDLLVADATVAMRDGLLAASRGRNPLTPTVVIGNGAAADPRDVVSMYLGRPLERVTFVCTVSMAMMDGRPARRSARKLANRFEAIVNGVPSHIIDVSREGVRLELPRDRRMVAPQFALRVPIIGVGVSVQRVWVRVPRPEENVGVMWCGGQLSKNTELADQAWLRFIDTLASVTPQA